MPDTIPSAPASAPETPDGRRWTALVFIALTQLMTVLDSTIVNIALPAAQHDLGISDADKQWAITAYALAFGGLLLLGGRIADLWGRKRALVTGLVGFALASALGGAAPGEATMFGARALQGVFAALLAPATLSLLAVMFTDAKERTRAFGIYGAITGVGGALGLILGGFLTEYLSWRWTFFVNIPFAVVAATGALFVIREPAGGRHRAPLDIPGVMLATTGLVALVYGFTRAGSAGGPDTLTVYVFVASAVLLLAFVLTEAKVRFPLLPLRVLTERNRAGAYLVLGLAAVPMFGLFLFLTYYLQLVQGYSPVRTGFAFLPVIAGMIIGSTQLSPRLTTRFPPRLVMAPALLLAAVSMLLLTRLEVDSAYADLLLPTQLTFGVGIGTALTPAMSLATHGIEPHDAGVASAMVNASQRVGGAVGTALLNTVAASATTAYLSAHPADVTTPAAHQLLRAQALVNGCTQASWWATGILVLATLTSTVLVNTGVPHGSPSPSPGNATSTADTEGAAQTPQR
ncbi:MFS transporter [Streptomyces sp. S186]|uniref:MFS transporter n=1 Tax=Streptomyces sp. S186 TaxID=3434395 RepID=UPI003F67F57B